MTSTSLTPTCMQAALCTATGAVAGYGYLMWVCYDVDRVTEDDETPMRDVDQIRGTLPRRIARVLLGMRIALTSPRLLVPIGLGCSVAAFNEYSGEHLTLTEEGCVVLGFLSFKLALFSKIYEDLRPRFGGPKGGRTKPVYREIDDEWDMYGRVKTQPRGVIEADRILAEEAAKKGKQ